MNHSPSTDPGSHRCGYQTALCSSACTCTQGNGCITDFVSHRQVVARQRHELPQFFTRFTERGTRCKVHVATHVGTRCTTAFQAPPPHLRVPQRCLMTRTHGVSCDVSLASMRTLICQYPATRMNAGGRTDAPRNAQPEQFPALPSLGSGLLQFGT